ncbi:MAG: hypothetical protein HYU88_09480 [Chloroflexi bacterium]|nr:hypothetical protein [Chloroflexota bacterium]MBI4506550.1 hypothetical protein [Chloroflexota bacterium]
MPNGASAAAAAGALAAIAEAADVVEITAAALPLEIAGPTDAAAALDLWDPAAKALAALASDPDLGPADRHRLAALQTRGASLASALSALRAARAS